jgi:hypothetical protein
MTVADVRAAVDAEVVMLDKTRQMMSVEHRKDVYRK